jgi:hypothetical protein
VLGVFRDIVFGQVAVQHDFSSEHHLVEERKLEQTSREREGRLVRQEMRCARQRKDSLEVEIAKFRDASSTIC